MSIRVPKMPLVLVVVLAVVTLAQSTVRLVRYLQCRAVMETHPCGEQTIRKLVRWWATATVAAILLGFAVTPGPASAENAGKGPIGSALFIQYPTDATAMTDGASGDLSISGTGVLSSDYSYSGIHWANPNGVEYWVNPASSGVSVSTTVSSVRAAFDTWGNASGPLSFTYQGATSLGAGYQDSKNIVSWGDLSAYPGTIALTYYWYYVYSGEIVEADTRMSNTLLWSSTAPNVTHDLSAPATENASRYSDPTNSGTSGRYDIQNIMTHEAGHWLSLDDLYGGTQSELAMYGYGATGELKKDTLAYGDELGVESIYPMQITIITSGLVSSFPASVHYLQGGVSKTATTYGTWSSAVDDGSMVSIDSEVATSSTERHSTMAETSWNATQSATYTVPYYHQYKPDISAVTAGTGHTDISDANHATLTYHRFGSAGTINIFDTKSFNDWVDAGSTANLSNHSSSASTSTHRWYCSETTSWVVNDANLRVATYWEQFKPAISVVTAGTGHTDLDYTNSAVLTYRRFGAAEISYIGDGWGFYDWVDIGSTASLSDTSSGSTSTHRWYCSETTSWVVNDANLRSATYREQFKATLALTGLSSSCPATISVVQGGIADTPAVSSSWSDWADSGSALSISSPVTLSSEERYMAYDKTSWTVGSVLTAEVHYAHQFLASIDINGLKGSHSATVTFVQDVQTNSLPVSDKWSNWVNAGSTLTIDKSVEGGWIGDWSTGATTDWTVDSPISASIRYHRSYVGLYLLIGALLVGATIIGAGIFFLLRIRRKGYALRDLPGYLSDRLDL
jgi:hypothetical protein